MLGIDRIRISENLNGAACSRKAAMCLTPPSSTTFSEAALTKGKTVLVVSAVVAVAALLLGASILTDSKSQPSDNVASVGDGGATTGSRSLGDAAANSELPNAATDSRTPTSDSQPGASGASATSPVRARDPLTAVGSVPAKTLAFVEESKARAGDSYSVVFIPYGYGPGGKGRSLVVRVNRSTPDGKPSRPYPARRTKRASGRVEYGRRTVHRGRRCLLGDCRVRE